MPFRSLLRLAGGAGLLMALAACTQSAPQEFGVSGAPPSPAGTVFRSTDPNIDEAQARAYCAGGYDKLGEQNFTTDSGTITQWRIRCTPYAASSPLPFL